MDRRAFLRSAAVAALGTMVPALPAVGSVPVPLYFPQDPTVTRFTSSFGYVKPDGRVHMGNDLHAPKHSPVYAAADGVVTRLGFGVLAGYYAVIAHGDGWETLYVHLNEDRRRGDDRRGRALAYADGIERGVFVVAGQQIGYVGDSGNAKGTSPHTHFELHHRGRPVDPYLPLLAAFRRVREAQALEAIPLVEYD